MSCLVRSSVLAALIVQLAGCLVVPTPEHGLVKGRGKVAKQDLEGLQPGVTTRADVLLLFGEPDAVRYDESVFAYNWEVLQGYWAVATMGGAGAAPYTDKHGLFLEFDEEGLLVRFGHESSIWVSRNDDLLDGWMGVESPRRVSYPDTDIALAPAPRYPAHANLLGQVPALRLRIAPIAGGRQSVGQKTALGIHTNHFVLQSQTTNTLLLDLFQHVWTAGGHEVVSENEDFALITTSFDLELSTPGGAFKWHTLCELELELVFEPLGHGRSVRLRRSYAISSRKKGFGGPGADDGEEVIGDCLEKLARELANDAGLAAWLDRLGKN